MISNYQNVIQLLEEKTKTVGNKSIYIFLEFNGDQIEENSLTYADLARRAKSIAHTIQQYTHTDDRVLLIYQPGIEFIIAFFACIYAGVIAVPVYPPTTHELVNKLQHIIQNSKPSLILSTSSIANKIKQLRFIKWINQIPFLSSIIKPIAPHAYQKASKLIDWDFNKLRWLTTDKINIVDSELYLDVNIKPSQLVFLQYTSGSTDKPKGVMVSHQNLIYNLTYIRNCFGVTPKDSSLIWLPPYHDMGLIGGLLGPILSEMQTVVTSPIVFLQQPLRWLKLVSKYRATITGAPNFAYDLVVAKATDEDIKEIDLSLLQVAFTGAEQIRSKTLKNFTERFKTCGFNPKSFFPCYGLAEVTLLATGVKRGEGYQKVNIDGELLKHNIVSERSEEDQNAKTYIACGEASFDTEIIIVDETTCTRLGENQIGSIWIKSPSVTMGYWNASELTEHTFKAYLANGEGPYLRSGDLGYLHHNHLIITGRIKDILIIRGKNYYPHDIEDVIQHCHPGIRLNCCAVFALDNGEKENLIVVQEIKKEFAHEAKEIANKIRNIIIHEHGINPDTILLCDKKSIPKTTSGKIQRNLCKKHYLEGKLQKIYVAQNEHQKYIDLAQLPQTNLMKKRFDNKVFQHYVNTLKEHDTVTKNLSKADIKKYLIDFVNRITQPSILLTADVKDDTELNLDSLQKMELIHLLETDLKIHFHNDEMLSLDTVESFINSIDKIQYSSKNSIKNFTHQNAKIQLISNQSIFAQAFRHLLQSIILRFTNFYFNIQTKNAELLPTNKPFIIIANHCSHLDSIMLMVGSRLPLDEFVIMGAKDYCFDKSSFKFKLINLVLQMAAFDRTSSPSAMQMNTELCRQYVASGKKLILYPEAKRSLNGQLQTFKSGAAVLAAQLQLPIVPAYIKGTHACLPKGRMLPKRGEISITFGHSIDPKQFINPVNQYQSYRKLTETMQNAVEILGKTI